MDKVILHCDLNNFYASVECVLHPELYGKPVAVCGDPKNRHGIVLAKSQAAKVMGVKTGEAIWEARQKCPGLIVVMPTFEEYVKYSNIVFNLYTEYTDRVESFGIDECWLDVTASVKLFGSGEKIANELRERVKALTGLTISVGVSFTKVFAKLGSDLKKPDATTVITRENYKDIVWKLDVGEMLMIGKSSQARLNKLNIMTIGDLARADRKVLAYHFGIVGDKMIENANGVDNESVKYYYDKHVPKSLGHSTTTAKDVKNLSEAKIVIYALSEMVATRLRKYNLLAGVVSVGLRDANLNWISRQTQLMSLTANANVLAETALKLLKENHNFTIPLRTISVYTQKLSTGVDGRQLTLFDEIDDREKRLEESVDKIREKYGYKSVQRAVLVNNDVLADNLHEEDEFLPFKRN
jgi:Nucleotidyltransferase/DNA polymerase involved in DNA repair